MSTVAVHKPVLVPRDARLAKTASISLLIALVLAVVASAKPSWRTDVAPHAQPDALLPYTGARFGLLEMCYSLADIEMCHSYTTPSEFLVLNRTLRSTARITLTACELRDDARLYGTEIQQSIGATRFLNGYCGDDATTWAPLLQIVALAVLFAALLTLNATFQCGCGKRREVVLTMVSAGLGSVGAALQVATIVVMTVGYEDSDIGYGSSVYYAIVGLLLMTASVVCALLSIKQRGGHAHLTSPSTTEQLV